MSGFSEVVFGGGHTFVMQINDAGLHVVKRWELFMPEPYMDSNGMWAIYYGHTNAMGTDPYVTKDGVYPKEEIHGHNILVQDMNMVGKTLKRWIKVPVTDYMFTALCSISLNAGLGNVKNGPIESFDDKGKPIRGKSILAFLNEEDYVGAATRFLDHDRATIEVTDKKTGEKRYEIRKLRGLLLRRCAEVTLFMTKKE